MPKLTIEVDDQTFAAMLGRTLLSEGLSVGAGRSDDDPEADARESDTAFLLHEVRTTVEEMAAIVTQPRPFGNGAYDPTATLVELTSHVGYLRGLLAGVRVEAD